MALPKRKHSKTRQAKRRTHYILKAPNISECPRCHAPKLPHHVCLECGFYNGRLVISRTDKKEKKAE